jgi:hypothetical protein
METKTQAVRMSDDDTVRTEGHGTIEDTNPIAVRRVSQTQSGAKFTPGRALPPQSPPVTDIHLLEFHPPEVPSGSVARYKPRSDFQVTEIPEFDAEWVVRKRAPREIAPGDVVAHQADGRRAWHRRVWLTVIGITLAAAAVAVVGIEFLSHL